MKYILLIALLLTSCGTMTPTPSPTDALQDLLEQTDPKTGEPYTLERATEIQAAGTKATENKDWMNRLLSTKIMILFALTSVGLVVGGAMSFYRGNIPGSIACAVGAIGVLALPIIIIVLFKALMFLLYVFYGLVIVAVIAGGYMLYKRLHNKDKALTGVVDTVEKLKEKYPNEWALLKEEGLEQCDITEQEVKQVKANGGSK